MERKDVVRILELIENPELEKKPDEHFVLKEYLKYIGENRVATGYIFSIRALKEKTRNNRFNGQISNTELAINKGNENTAYKFHFKNGCNLLSPKASNNICNLEVIIPREIQVKHADDPQLIDFEEYLDTTAIIVRKKAFANHMSLQKRNQYVKTVFTIGLSALALGAAAYFVVMPYIGEQQAAQRQIDYQKRLEQNITPMTPELQQQLLEQYQIQQDNKEYYEFLESIREENEATKKLP